MGWDDTPHQVLGRVARTQHRLGPDLVLATGGRKPAPARTALAVMLRMAVSLAIVLGIGCSRKSAPPSERTSPAPSSVPADTAAAPPATPDRTAGIDSLSRAHELVETLELQALGNEPFWSLGVTRSGIVYRTPERPSGFRFPYVRPVVDGPRLIFTSTRPDSTPREIRVVIQEHECNDGMSDKIYRFAAEVQLDALDLHGCARYRPPPESP